MRRERRSALSARSNDGGAARRSGPRVLREIDPQWRPAPVRYLIVSCVFHLSRSTDQGGDSGGLNDGRRRGRFAVRGGIEQRRFQFVLELVTAFCREHALVAK